MSWVLSVLSLNLNKFNSVGFIGMTYCNSMNNNMSSSIKLNIYVWNLRINNIIIIIINLLYMQALRLPVCFSLI